MLATNAGQVGRTWCNQQQSWHDQVAKRHQLSPSSQVSVVWNDRVGESFRLRMGSRVTYGLVDSKDSTDVDTCIDVAATIQGIEDDTVFAAEALFDYDSLV